MKTILQTGYGPPRVCLHLAEVEQPTPEDDQALIKVHAASPNALDWRPFTMSPILIRFLSGGWRTPKDPRVGVALAGRVEAVGRSVSRFRAGDAVFGVGPGAFAEYTCAAEAKLAHKPAHVSFEQAATLPVAAITALQGLRDRGRIQAGQKVLIYGASGGVGTFAVQIAKAFGGDVTAVCSTRNVNLMRRLGADRVIDYTKEDFAEDAARYDLIAAVNGHRPILDYWRALAPNGICIFLGGSMPQILQGLLLGPVLSRLAKKRVQNMLARSKGEDHAFLGTLVEAGKVTPVIDRSYPLPEVADAIHYMIEEHARGKVVITIEPSERTSHA